MIDAYVLKFADESDLASWMALVERMKYNFPSLEIAEEMEKYRQTVLRNIGRRSALRVKRENRVVGALLFSYRQSCLSCLAVHPAHRRAGVASALIEKMLSLLPPDKDVWVITFREDDEKGAAPRALYRKFGFVEDELVVDHNYPEQKFILHRQ